MSVMSLRIILLIVVLIGSILLLGGAIIKRIRYPQSGLLAAISGGLGLIYLALNIGRPLLESGLPDVLSRSLSHLQYLAASIAGGTLILFAASEIANAKACPNRSPAEGKPQQKAPNKNMDEDAG